MHSSGKQQTRWREAGWLALSGHYNENLSVTRLTQHIVPQFPNSRYPEASRFQKSLSFWPSSFCSYMPLPNPPRQSATKWLCTLRSNEYAGITMDPHLSSAFSTHPEREKKKKILITISASSPVLHSYGHPWSKSIKITYTVWPVRTVPKYSISINPSVSIVHTDCFFFSSRKTQFKTRKHFISKLELNKTVTNSNYQVHSITCVKITQPATWALWGHKYKNDICNLVTMKGWTYQIQNIQSAHRDIRVYHN
jgi:hypothetical protein